MNLYYFCVQGLEGKPELNFNWLSVAANNENEAWNQAYHFYRKICDLDNDDLLGICMMEKHYVNER